MRRIAMICALLAGALLPALAQEENSEDITHVVGAGDTLLSIAHAYGVTLDQLLTLNALQPESLLQIGQRLLVMRAPEFVDEDDIAPAEAPETEPEREVGGDVVAEDLPRAPVTAADAPMRDPADIRPRLCFAVFEDENQNGVKEPGEDLLKDATIVLRDGEHVELLRYTTDGAAEPFCPPDLGRGAYFIEGGAPPGFGLTASANLRVDLRAGGAVMVDFGARQGLERAPAAPSADLAASDAVESLSERRLLLELSGLFALALAGVVFCGGLAVSLFLRWH